MDKKDAVEYIKELEELSFGYASIIGYVIQRNKRYYSSLIRNFIP